MINLSTLYILIAGILWGTMSLFVRNLNSYGFSPMEIVFLRAFGTMLLMGLFLRVTDKKAFKIKLKDIWVFFGMGVMSILFFNYCYFNSILLTSASISAILLYTSPVFVIILSAVIFKERLTVKKIIALMLALSGCVMVVNPRGDFLNIGAVYGILSGFLYALYTIFGRFAVNKYKTKTILFYAFLFSFIGALLLIKPFKFASAFIKGGTALWLYAVLTVIVTTILPYAFYTKGLEKVSSGKASVIVCVEPVVASLISVFVFNEEISRFAFFGIMLVIFSILILNIKRKNSQKRVDF